MLSNRTIEASKFLGPPNFFKQNIETTNSPTKGSMKREVSICLGSVKTNILG